MSADKVTYAYFEVRGCKAEFYLNGIPCVRLDASDISVQSQAVQELLVPGANELEILIEPGDHPSAARSHARNANVKDMFARAAVTDIPPDLPTQPEYGTVLADVEFKLRPSEPEERSVPISVGGSFTLTRMTARWAWQDSPAMVLDEALKLDDRRRTLLPELEERRRLKNEASRRIGELLSECDVAASTAPKPSTPPRWPSGRVTSSKLCPVTPVRP